MNVVGLLAGVLSLTLGVLGVSGRLDKVQTPVRLYRQSGNVDAGQHRRGQRVGGAALIVGGLVLIAFALSRLLT